MSNLQRTRSIAFTLNNPTEVEDEALFNMLRDDETRTAANIRFAGVGKEVGEEGTPHFQGFLYFTNAKTFSAAHKLPGLARAHFEIIKGTPDDNVRYCSKEGDYEDFGVKPCQGARSDLDTVSQLVTSGKRIADVAFECPVQFIKFHKGIEKLIALQVSPRDYKTEVLWFWGPTGTGKSKTAFDLASEESGYYVKDPLNKWWDGYEQQHTVIIDDYRRDFSTFAQLLRLFDRYPMTVEAKGSTTQFSSQRIIVTTPKSPKDTWEGRSDEEIGQLLRRITRVHHYNTPL